MDLERGSDFKKVIRALTQKCSFFIFDFNSN